MSETAKVRLVRCPKCENLLPEVTDFSVYQCGGCGAVLRAKNKGVDLDTFSNKSDEERIGGNISDRRVTEMSDGSESDVRSTISSSSRTERRNVLRDMAEISRNGFNKKDVEVDVMRDRRSNQIQRPKMTQDFDDFVMYNDSGSGLRRLGRVGDGRIRERSEIEGGWSGRAKEGSLDYNLSAYSYEFDDPSMNRNDVDGLNDVEFVGDDRADLLRQLDELKDKLMRSGNLNDKGKEKIPLDKRRMTPHEPPHLMRRQEMAENGFYPPRYAPTHVQGYGNNPSRSQMHRRGPLEAQTSFQMPQPRKYASGPYMDQRVAYMESFEPYPPNVTRHHPSCSCYQCQQFSSYRIPDPPPLRTPGGQAHARWPSDANSEADGFIRRRPNRPHLGSGVKHCFPIGGGAPFVTCTNCTELLLLPKKVVNKNGTTKKLKCGACCSVIALVASGKSLAVSPGIESLKVDNTRDLTTFSSEDYDSGYDFHSMDTEVANKGRDNKSIKTRNRHSTSTCASEAEEEKGPTPPAGSSLQDYFEYPKKDLGNRSGRSEQNIERVLPNKNVAKQLLRKESTATEIDISSNEFSNTGSTFESSEASRGGRGAGSFFAGIMGTFKESNRSEESSKQENACVTVNGHLISDRLMKKAEKLAGHIQPGHYWYDFRAGFWGVVGGPCLGIIPPFIEEFNYPMPENCAAGNTHIFVNGRELNHKDLNLLGSRGLPRERDRSYIVEISGRVLDEETGEELESLGKLAPTMEKAKRGFGMRVPQQVA